MKFDELYDDFAGSLNLLDMLEGFIRGLAYGDFGHQIVLRRVAKGGAHHMSDAIQILKGYGVDTFWYGFDSQNMYFRVKKRQARWAEYVLLHAGVELLNPAFDHRNAGYAARHAPGWMPRPWSAGRAETVDKSMGENDSPAQEQPRAKGILGWLDSLGT